jgi:DNA ligase-1
MKAFSKLYQKLERSKSASFLVEELLNFFAISSDEDKLWCIALFSQKRPKRIVKPLSLRLWVTDLARIPDWLFEESYNIVGDQAETAALLLPIAKQREEKSLSEWIQEILNYSTENKDLLKEWVLESWSLLDKDERLLFNKLITGTFRKNLPTSIIAKALSLYLEIDEKIFVHRLNSDWSPTEISFQALLQTDHYKDYISKPYPFYYGNPLNLPMIELGNVIDWIAEWKWDGFRAQLISRDGEIFLWSRNGELVNDSFPELLDIAKNIDYDFVLDGEIIAYKNGQPLNYTFTSKRLGKKKVTKNLLLTSPVVFMAYDLLEYRTNDIRHEPLTKRKELLGTLMRDANNSFLKYSDTLSSIHWTEMETLLETARSKQARGIFLKHKTSTYKEGRFSGDWWKIKAAPHTIEAILIYAHRSQGRGISNFVEYSFALWENETLVTFTKASEGLSAEEESELALFVKQNTIERFGPVYSVNPILVFELSFEGIIASKRHKSGIALRKPKIKKWKINKEAKEADTLEAIKKLII